MYLSTGVSPCYTLEANYYNGKRMNYLSPMVDVSTGDVMEEKPLNDIRSSHYMDMPVDKFPGYTIPFYEEIG
jgi:hypothetical protein